MEQPQDIQQLRHELTKLRKEREAVILEKGLLAQDNKDLRENFAYILYEQKEHALSSQINAVIKEIYDYTKKHKKRI